MDVRDVSFRKIVEHIPGTTYATHGLYMYPAKFIPHVVRYAIEKYTEPGDWVFDPFAGYGTVAVEASLTGRNAVLWDLNPFLEVLTLASTYKSTLLVRDFELDWDYDQPFNPQWGNISYWHPREFYEVLSRLWGYWHREVYGKAGSLTELQRAYAIAIPLLKTTRFFSYSDEKIAKLYKSKHAVEKVKTLLSTDWKNKMKKMYWDEARRVVEKIREYNALSPKDVEIVLKTSRRQGNRLVVFDSLLEKLDRDVKLLITSPPYLQAQEYIRSFKLELAWLGYSGEDLKILARHEIPYNPYNNPGDLEVFSETFKRFKHEIERLNHSKLLNLYNAYFKSLVRFFSNNYTTIQTVALFVGHATIRGIRVPVDKILREHLEALGFEHIETLRDRIEARRLFETSNGLNPATNIKVSRLKEEYLLVMKNPK